MISPDLLQKIPASSLTKYQELVTRHSREKIEAEKKALLDEIAALYAAMLLSELENALSRWSALESNPLFSCTPEEKIQIDDARTFLLDQQAEANKKELFSSLQNQLEQLLNDEADPKEIDRVYHSMQQLDRPIKPLLEERMADLYAKVERDSKRRHVRRCIYWGLSVMLLAAIIFTAIFLVQREREFRQDSGKIRDFIGKQQYEAALEYCAKIEQERPHIAKRPEIVALRREAEGKLEENRQMAETFEQACNDLETKYLNEQHVLDDVIPKLFEELEERAQHLPEEKSKRMIALQQKYEDLKTQVHKKNELEFLKAVNVVEGKWNQFLRDLNNFQDDDAAQHCAGLKTESERVLSEHQAKILPKLHDEWVRKFESFDNLFKDKMENRLNARKRIRELLHPSSLSAFSKALDNIDQETNELQTKFARAKGQFPDAVSLNNVYSSKNALTAVLDQFPQDPYCRDVKRAVNHPEQQQAWRDERSRKLASLRSTTLQKHYDLFEVIMKSNNMRYHLYIADAKEDLVFERDWNGVTLKALRISFVQANSGLKADAVLQVNEPEIIKTAATEKPMTYTFVSVNGKLVKKSVLPPPPPPSNFRFVRGQKFDQLPEILSFEDISFFKDSGSLKKASHYNVLKNQIDFLDDRISCHKVLIAIDRVIADRTITNVYAKVHLLKQLYALLPVDQLPHYQKELKSFADLLDAYTATPEQARWQDPTATFKHQDDVVNFQKKLDALNIRDAISILILSDLLLKKVELFSPVAAGVFFHEENGTWCFRPFTSMEKDVQLKTTVFVFDDNAANMHCIAFQPIRFFKGVGENDLPAELKGKLFHGQIVYFNRQLTNWEAEFQQVESSLKRLGYGLPVNTDHILWPEIWPLNHRNVSDLKSK